MYVLFIDKENNNCIILCCFVIILMCVIVVEIIDLCCLILIDIVGIVFFLYVWEWVNFYKYYMYVIGVIFWCMICL